MPDYSIFDVITGRYVMSLTMPDRDQAMLNVKEGQELAEGYFDEFHYLKNGEVKALPEKPANYLLFDLNAETWIDPRTDADHAAELARARDAALARITVLRGKARLSYITDLPGQDMLYMAKAEEARAWLADPDPDPAAYPLVMSEVGVTAETAWEVAQIFANLSALWRYAAGSLDAACFQAEAAVRQAPGGSDGVVRIALAITRIIRSGFMCLAATDASCCLAMSLTSSSRTSLTWRSGSLDTGARASRGPVVTGAFMRQTFLR